MAASVQNLAPPSTRLNNHSAEHYDYLFISKTQTDDSSKILRPNHPVTASLPSPPPPTPLGQTAGPRACAAAQTTAKVAHTGRVSLSLNHLLEVVDNIDITVYI